MAREDSVEIFKDTMKFCRINSRIKAAMEQSIKKQKLILEKDAIVSVQMFYTLSVFG